MPRSGVDSTSGSVLRYGEWRRDLGTWGWRSGTLVVDQQQQWREYLSKRLCSELS